MDGYERRRKDRRVQPGTSPEGGCRLQAVGCKSGVAPTLVETLSPMLLSCLGVVMQRLGRFELMEDEALPSLWGEMDKGSEGLE